MTANAEKFVAWLTTQLNTRGTLYLERVSLQYARCLLVAPAKLNLPLVSSERDVFACQTTEQFKAMRNEFYSAQNFKDVNAIGHQTFSSALKCYERYLNREENLREDKLPNMANDVALETDSANAAPRTADFSDSRQYEITHSVGCVVNSGRITHTGEVAKNNPDYTKPLVSRTAGTADVERQYKEWIIETGKSEKTANQYTNILRSSIGKTFNFGGKIKANMFEYVTLEAFEVANTQIWSLTNFTSVNESKHNSFSAALNSYLKFLRSDIGATPLAEHRTIYATTTKVDNETVNAINAVLYLQFSNGFRLGSGIELNRLRKFVNEMLGKETPLSGDELEMMVKACGTVFEGKLYVVSGETKARIKEFAEDYFYGGATAIFYEEYYAKNEHWLFEAGVVSKEMLLNILHSAFPQMKFTHTYFGPVNDNDSVYNVLQSEILRVWGDDVLLNYEALAERLTYIPLERIKYALGQKNDFIGNSRGEFTHLSLIDITEEEKTEIRQFVEKKIQTHGYVSIMDIQLMKIFERNCALSSTAIHNGVYRTCLANNYNKQGKIITRKGDKVDAQHLIEEHCSSLDRATLDELRDYVEELTGYRYNVYSEIAAYAVMVRIGQNAFVSEGQVHFDTIAIDSAIEQFINGGEYISLKAVTTFAPFPHCGQAWNLFLLESYCRRFSANFRFEVLSFNSSNAGAVVRKHSQMMYTDIMADAVAKSGIILNEHDVKEFLWENGYIASRLYKRTAELIHQAKVLRG
jgi:hypothetical protein